MGGRVADRRLASRFQAAKDGASDAAAGDRRRTAGRLEAVRRAPARAPSGADSLTQVRTVTGAVENEFAR